jgi:hypothetical protein
MPRTRKVVSSPDDSYLKELESRKSKEILSEEVEKVLVGTQGLFKADKRSIAQFIIGLISSGLVTEIKMRINEPVVVKMYGTAKAPEPKVEYPDCMGKVSNSTLCKACKVLDLCSHLAKSRKREEAVVSEFKGSQGTEEGMVI